MAKKPAPRIILGLSTGHGDSSAAIIVDGILVAAAEEERFNRVKHYALFPRQAVQFCLAQAGAMPHDVQAVVVARKPLNLLADRLRVAWQFPRLLRTERKRRQGQRGESLVVQLRSLGLKEARIHRVEHHLAHLMSARMLTPTESISLLSFDGLGDFVSAAMGRGQGHGVEILERVTFPHSLGFFYSAMTHYLGFPHYGDEYKVMGLSAYGEPRFLSAMRILVREAEPFGFKLNLEAFPVTEKVNFWIENGQPKISPKYHANFLTQLLGVPPRKPTDPMTEAHWDVAKSVQARFEEIANHCLRQLHDHVPTDTLGLAGGCAHNSVWVGKIPQSTPFKKILVAPASHDAGLAVGAAASVADRTITPAGGHWALLGPDRSEIEDSNEFTGRAEIKRELFRDDESLCRWIVAQLCARKIVGICRGKMEFGPRALGNRSILADPRQPEMRDILNRKVKHRETFRPFAASVLWEHQDEWFHNAFLSPTMEAVFEVKQPSRVPAIVHVDNTCRIQSVTKESQPFFWNLLDHFRKKTGIPLLLNTSFNDNEPIVCSGKDALDCFIKTGVDCVVVGRYVYARSADNLALTA